MTEIMAAKYLHAFLNSVEPVDSLVKIFCKNRLLLIKRLVVFRPKFLKFLRNFLVVDFCTGEPGERLELTPVSMIETEFTNGPSLGGGEVVSETPKDTYNVYIIE